MEIIQKIADIPNLSLALGFFDGVHIAHQKLIENAVNYAKKNNIKSAVITLKQQPYCYLNHIAPKYISSRAYSFNLIEHLEVDYLFELDFDVVSGMSSFEYLKNVLVKNFSPVGIFTGFNHHFGHNRAGNCEFLEKYQSEFNYHFEALPSQTLNGNLISSSAIRKFLESGQIENANSMLGREFCVDGTVVEGNKIGRTISFPTANINYPDNIVEVPNGVYGVNVELSDGRVLKGIANFGTKPTVNATMQKTLETHILDGFDEDIYGQKIKINFLKFIRREQKFKNIEKLKEQIKSDINSL
ncbi:bifunctional riboflavin kinase/FAD synthetase [bacterium]|nr:bifunctional riboflavin kinase/FAD synthetase [bacterium]